MEECQDGDADLDGGASLPISCGGRRNEQGLQVGTTRPIHVWADRVPAQESTCPTSVPAPRGWHGLGPVAQDTCCQLTGWVCRNRFCKAHHGLQIREQLLTTFCLKQRPLERFAEQVWLLCPYSVVPFFKYQYSYFFSKPENIHSLVLGMTINVI